VELAENKSSGILRKKDVDEKPKRKLTWRFQFSG